jgi:hypothetical protein
MNMSNDPPISRAQLRQLKREFRRALRKAYAVLDAFERLCDAP